MWYLSEAVVILLGYKIWLIAYTKWLNTKYALSLIKIVVQMTDFHISIIKLTVDFVKLLSVTIRLFSRSTSEGDGTGTTDTINGEYLLEGFTTIVD